MLADVRVEVGSDLGAVLEVPDANVVVELRITEDQGCGCCGDQRRICVELGVRDKRIVCVSRDLLLEFQRVAPVHRQDPPLTTKRE